jgi:hypothetical protein
MSASFIAQLTGTNVKPFKETQTWSPNSQLEVSYFIKDTDGSQVVPYTDVEEIVLMVFKSATTFNLSMTVSGSTVVVSGTLFTFEADSTFITNLSQIQVSTDSTTDQLIEVAVYGEVASS